MMNMASSVKEGGPSLVDMYKNRESGGYDELLDPNGVVRLRWRGLLAGLGEFTASELNSRTARIDRRVRETGVAYDMFADPDQVAQKWQLDLMPIVISSAEWRWLAAALVQRARLFDRLLADLYGPQELMRQGLVPPELVFSDNAYLRPCQGILDKAGPLRFYAADLARGADGKWRVIDNHLETLAGIGFVLANRVAHTHVTGDLFKRVNAVRLAAHFQRLQVALAAHAQRDNASIALLTPGPQHQDYFSHAYLARYLGLLLVEGSDLRTRGSHVYLKTLEGLKEVDLIIRCVDGRQIDPLELDPAGFKGPAGLLQGQPRAAAASSSTRSARQWRRTAASAPICRVSPSIFSARIWRSAMRHAGGSAIRPRAATSLDNLDGVVIRSAQEGTGRPGTGRARPGAAARFRPPNARGSRPRSVFMARALVAEEKIGFSTAPAFGAEGLEARPFAVRLYVAHTVNGFEAMPGGLAMSVDPVRAVALSAADGHTRDVWVLSDTQQAPHISLWRPEARERPHRAPAAGGAEPRRRRPLLARPLRRALPTGRCGCCAARCAGSRRTAVLLMASMRRDAAS